MRTEYTCVHTTHCMQTMRTLQANGPCEHKIQTVFIMQADGRQRISQTVGKTSQFKQWHLIMQIFAARRDKSNIKGTEDIIYKADSIATAARRTNYSSYFPINSTLITTSDPAATVYPSPFSPLMAPISHP